MKKFINTALIFLNEKRILIEKRILAPYKDFYENNVRKYLKYTSYLFRHKWFVMIECFSIGLIWRGLKHDWDKFLPSSFIAYARFFGKVSVRDESGYYSPTGTGDLDFKQAWFRHTRRHTHHWQHWVLSTETNEELFEMPYKAVKEMVCDWIGAGRAQGKTDVRGWWNANKSKMKFHQDTIIAIEKRLEEVEAWKILKAQMSDVE